jgi:transcriptional regulator with XRE-family HTH domain
MKKLDNSECLCYFGDWIRRERERQGLTQAEVANLVGMHQTYYGRIELADRVVDLVDAIKIARALRLDLSDFIKEFM